MRGQMVKCSLNVGNRGIDCEFQFPLIKIQLKEVWLVLAF